MEGVGETQGVGGLGPGRGRVHVQIRHKVGVGVVMHCIDE